MITLRPYQQKALDSVFNFFRSGKEGNPLVIAPTGSGKSVIISGFCKAVVDNWPGQKILVISHVKEILQQNFAAIEKHIPGVDIGIYSAGLKSKTIKNITVAGIQSIYKKPKIFKDFDIFLIDECHMIPKKGQGRYRTFMEAVKKPMVGFTATPFRLGSGYLHTGSGAMFDEIVYTIPIKKLIAAGHLCNVSTKGSKQKMNPAGIKKNAGDFIIKDLALAFNREEITNRITNELLLYKKTRKKWLIFAIDISHADNIAYFLNQKGIKTKAVHTKMNGTREAAIESFKNGSTQAVVSVAVLTTGFDAPDVDVVVLMRPTASPVLHVQIIGRGLRPSDKKGNCLVLDYAGNLLRNGPIDSPIISITGDGEGDPILKECPECFEIVHAATRICPACQNPFLFRHHLKSNNDAAQVLKSKSWHDVKAVKYSFYISKAGNPTIKVTYICGLRTFSEYLPVESKGFPRHRAEHWWSRRHQEILPDSTDRALSMAKGLKTPVEILVDESGKYPNIKDQKFI